MLSFRSAVHIDNVVVVILQLFHYPITVLLARANLTNVYH